MTDNGNNFDQESLLKSENMTLTGCLRMGQRRISSFTDASIILLLI